MKSNHLKTGRSKIKFKTLREYPDYHSDVKKKLDFRVQLHTYFIRSSGRSRGTREARIISQGFTSPINKTAQFTETIP